MPPRSPARVVEETQGTRTADDGKDADEDLKAQYNSIESTCGLAGPYIKAQLQPYEESFQQMLGFFVMFGLGYGQIIEGIQFDGKY